MKLPFRSTTPSGNQANLRALSPRFLLTSAAVMFLAPGAHAANLIWDGGSPLNSNWGTGANWQGDVAPRNPALPAGIDDLDVIQFAGEDRLAPVVDAPWAIDTLYFNSGAGSFELSGETITLQPSNGNGHDSRRFIINSSGKPQVINNDIVVLPALKKGPDDTSSNGSGIGAGTSLTLNGNLDIRNISALRFLGGTVIVNGVISGSPGGDTAVNSGATVIFNNTNTVGNGLAIWNGTVKVTKDSLDGVSGSLGNSTKPVVLGHSTLTNTGTLLTSAAVTIGRNIALARTTNGAAHTIGGDTADVSHYTGVIHNGSANAGASPLRVTAAEGGRVNINSILRRDTATVESALQDTVTKQGDGIVALTGTSDYSGATIVNAGTLLVNGTLADVSPNSTAVGDVSVSLNATLGGIGEINRNVVIADGGILSPGDMDLGGISQGGKLTLGADLSLSDASLLNFDLGAIASSGNDEVFVTGNLTLDGQLNIANLGAFGIGSYKLFEYTGALVNNGITFGNMPEGFEYSIDTTTSAQTVYLNVIPEPGSAALLAIGGALLAVRRRRR